MPESQDHDGGTSDSLRSDFKKQSSAAVAAQGPATNLWSESGGDREAPGIRSQPIGMRLLPPNQRCGAPTNQSSSSLTNQKAGAGTCVCVYIRELPKASPLGAGRGWGCALS